MDEQEKVKKTFKIQSDKGTNFNMDFLLHSGLLVIRAYHSVDGIKIFYENHFDLSYIQKVKLLTGHDTVEACLVDIFPSIDDKKVKLKEEDGKKNLVILLNSKEYPEITFELTKKEKKDKERIEELQNSLYYTKVEIIDLINRKFVEQSNIINRQNETISHLKNIIEKLSNEIKELKNKQKEDNFTNHIMKNIKGFDCFSKEYFDSINQKCPKCKNGVSNSGTKDTASDDHTGISTYVYVVNRNRIVYSRDCSNNNSVRNNLDSSGNITICGNIYICSNNLCKYSFAVIER